MVKQSFDTTGICQTLKLGQFQQVLQLEKQKLTFEEFTLLLMSIF